MGTAGADRIQCRRVGDVKGIADTSVGWRIFGGQTEGLPGTVGMKVGDDRLHSVEMQE